MKERFLQVPVSILTLILLLVIFIPPANANVHDTLYMDQWNLYDTVVICESTDSIMFVPNAGLNDIYWLLHQKVDTLHQDTIYLPGDYEGSVSCFGWNEPGGNEIYIELLTLSSENNSGLCGETLDLGIHTNYRGDNALFSWSPAAGLSDPAAAEPVATVGGDITYTVTLQTPDGCQVSAEASVTLEVMDPPEICIISVDSTNKNILYWERPASEAIDSFYVYRETNVTDVYEKIGAVNYDDYSKFIDTASHPDIQSNKYFISLLDSCGTETPGGLPHKTMHLAINMGQDNAWNLIWEPYEGFVVSTYNVYRGTTPKNLELIGTTSGNSTQYSDFEAPLGRVYYQVEVISPNGCDLFLPEKKSAPRTMTSALISSRSNIVSEGISGDFSVTGAGMFSVYPNPANHELFIEAAKAFNGISVAEICNMEGKVLIRTLLEESRTRLNISRLKTGLYTLKITGKDSQFVYKIFKNQ